jgi:DNA invertase Pin-like site-specific DNA recombinase
MTAPAASKVLATHLRRTAYLYIRQSSLHQVLQNTESTKRQYALQERAVALGWPRDDIVVIDCDLGQSGAAVDRAGFQQLVAEVGMGRAGIVLGLEVSRLARSSTDWHRLLEICALTDTLILDEDGIYDPGHFNDRLLLGLKGAMSEAELHVLHARLQGGMRHKAQRGELRLPLPTGFAYDPTDRIVLDPDQQVQETVRLFFATFRRTGSALATVRFFRTQSLAFPCRLRTDPNKGVLEWGPLHHSRALDILHNPCYAGAYCYGRRHVRRTVEGRIVIEQRPQEDWEVLLLEHHGGYLTWTEYQDNLRRLHENAQAQGKDRRQGPPREGPALLQGLVVCGICGERMTVRYHTRQGRQVPDYVCQSREIQRAEPICQDMPGAGIDAAIGSLLIELMTPLTLDVTLAVQEELTARAMEADRLRQQQVDRARYEVELARRRYMQVDPANRLVAASLEADWNDALRRLDAVQDEYERGRAADQQRIDDQQRAAILALATDFPRLWTSPQAADRERKRIIRLLIEDVTLRKDTQITAHVRFRGGTSRTLTTPIPPRSWETWQTDPLVVQEIDQFLDEHTDGEVAAILNERGYHAGSGAAFHRKLVAGIRRRHQLPDRFTRLRTTGLLTLQEMAALLAVHPGTVKAWHHHGLLRGIPFNDKGECLYEHPGDDPPRKCLGHKLSRRSFPPEHSESSAGGAV